MAKYVKTEEGYIETADFLDGKMDKENPQGTGSFSLNRKAGSTVGDFSHTEGYNTTASGHSSHAEGYNTTASGDASHAEGFKTTASGDDSHAEGTNATASGTCSHTEGYNTTASGNYSHAEGSGTTASGNHSHAEGVFSKALKGCSHAEGQDTTASGYASHAEGYNTRASKDYSHAEGYGTTALGVSSHAEGSNTRASKDYSHAEGYGTTALGVSSHAEGSNTTASGDESHAEGNVTKALSASQHVQGKFNIEDSSDVYADIIGNGTSSKPSNAATVDWSGNAWYAGDVYVGSTSGTNKDEGSKKLATEEYVNNSTASIEIPTALADLITDSTHRLVTDTEKSTWNAKAEVSAIPTKVSQLTNDSDFATNSDVTTGISTHNSSTEAHNDIRLLVQELTNKLNTLADSDDTTLDQLSEIVAYIKNNKSLIDSITTSKVSVTDIIDNLTTSATNKPLSAKQGVALKALIDAIVVPTKLPNPNAITFTGAAEGTYDGSSALTVDIPSAPEIPTQLPNPQSLIFTGGVTGSYDGSSEVSVRVPGDLSDLSEDAAHRVVTDAEKAKWNAKSNFSGSYNDLTDKPTIPDVPVKSVNGKTGAVVLSAEDVGALPGSTVIPTALPNPSAITFTGAVTGSYDGSAPMTVNIPTVDDVLAALPTWEGGSY